MSLNQLVSAKYVFIDVVNYTIGRPSEAQIDITASLNKIVKESVGQNKLSTQNMMFIPTGDGLCIVLKNFPYELYDASLKLALTILNKLFKYNENCNDKKRQYSVRIGLNENIDNIVIDINGNVNVSGAGINNCQRIMDFAGENQIMVGPQVHEVLSKREKYFEYFRRFEGVSVKNTKMDIYQFVDEKNEYLNSEYPPKFMYTQKTHQKIPEITAYFLALLNSRKDRILQLKNRSKGNHLKYTLIAAFWFLAHDLLEKSKGSNTDQSTSFSPFDSPDELIQYLDKINTRVICEFSGFIESQPDFSHWIHRCTEVDDAISLNEYGIEKLKEDWPQIFEDLCS